MNRLAIRGGRAPLLSDRGEEGEVYSEHFVILIDGQLSQVFSSMRLSSILLRMCDDIFKTTDSRIIMNNNKEGAARVSKI